MRRLLTYVGLAVVLAFAFTVATNVVVHVSTSRYIYATPEAAPSAGVALIPGAPLLPDGTPAPIFRDRVDTAIALYRAGKVDKILVSGDNSSVDHNEVDPVRIYLLDKGIPDTDIFLDHAGFDTYSTMYRASAIFGVSRMLITTQSFHLPRAVFIARSLGIEAYGVNADVGHILGRNYIREVFADEKAVFELFFHIRPKYLGEAIPIEGV